MTVKYDATITYNTGPNHPDAPNQTGLVFKDIYTIDPNYFYGEEDMFDYMKYDLALVAGGGYDTNTIKEVKYEFNLRRAQ